MADTERLDQLIEAIRSGDEAAVGRLHEKLTARLRGFVERRIGRRLHARVDADDVLQQTFVELIEIIRKGERPIRCLEPLARTIARNVIAQWARRKSVLFLPLDAGRARQDADSVPRWDPQARDTGPGTKVLRTERDELIQEALATLKPMQAVIVRLRYFSRGARKRKFSEIADVVGMTPEATEKACQRAKQRIQRFLQKNYPGSGLLGEL